MNYYNDNDPAKAAWLRQLIEEKNIPYGEVDERSIADVQPSDLDGFTQWHFFAGVGGWAKALRLAQWDPRQPVASGSVPCQPWSQAGEGLGYDDPRHLWPQFFRLARAKRFPVIFGEQVSSEDGCVWLAGIQADLEGADFEFGASDLCAAGVGAPQPRQRLFWVAYANGAGLQGRHFCGNRVHERNPWADGVAIPGRDGKRRRIEPGIQPLADGIPSRMELIGGAGDAIVPLVAAEFIQACEEARYV